MSEITDDTLCVQWLQGREPVYAQETVLCSRYSGKSYRKMLVCSRTGASITEAERLFLSERIDQEIQKRQSFHHILASDADQITAGKKDRVSLHQCRFTSNQTRRYASFLLKLVRLNARKRCPRDLPESVSKTKRTSPLLNSPKSTFTFAIHLNL